MSDRITLNLTEDDASTAEWEPAPVGWYAAEITEVEDAEVKKEGPNKGKPMYFLKFKSTDKEFRGTVRDTACLWNGAHYTIVNIGKALGLIKGAGEFVIPEADALIGEELEIRLGIEEYVNNDGEDAKRNVVKSYRSLEAGQKARAKGGKAAPAKAGAKASTGKTKAYSL